MQSSVELLVRESYLAMIKNAVGSNQFRNLYARVDGVEKDILENGKKSCAVFVSNILHVALLIKEPHATVSGLEKDLVESGWRRVDAPKEGDIIVWEPKLQGGETNAHVGFYIGDEKAISNNWETGVPSEHHMTYGGTRAITAFYTYDFPS